VSTRAVARDTWWLEFDCPDIARGARPGQFVMLGLGLDAPGTWLLPRPFSIGWRCGSDGRLGFLLRVFGIGTRALARLDEGDEALLLGPLGRPFEVDPGRDVELVAGGVGLAPFIFLAAEHRSSGGALRLLYGERDAGAVFDLPLLEELAGHAPELYTEDGSAGTGGLVTAGLDPASRASLYGCGPTPLLRALAAFAAAHGRDLQVSVEEHMGCGIGTCQGCVVPGADGRWIKACVEGPVFRSTELAWGDR